MFPPRTTIRSIIACTLACGLLATTTSAAAGCPTIPDGASTSCLTETTTTPRQDLRSPDARDAANAEQIARAMENYYESFSEPVPTAPFTSSAPASTPPADETPWLLISVMAGGLALVLASTALVLRRRRVAV
jgi:hypothetical protein